MNFFRTTDTTDTTDTTIWKPGFTVVVLSPNRLCNARLSPGDRLSFGLLLGPFASSNFTSSRKVSKPLTVEPVVPMLI